MDRRRKITSAFNGFSGQQSLRLLDSFYSQTVEFSDPVTKIKGLEKLKSYYSEVYRNVQSIQFYFHRFIEDDKSVSTEWTMTLTAEKLNGGRPFDVKGCSFFEFDKKDLVSYHRDYLDLGEMVYEKLPVFGKVIRLIKSNL